MSKPNFNALAKYDRDNQAAAEIVLTDPGQYGICMTRWAKDVLRRLEREKAEKEAREKRTNGTR